MYEHRVKEAISLASLILQGLVQVLELETVRARTSDEELIAKVDALMKRWVDATNEFTATVLERREPSDDEWKARFSADWEAFCVKHGIGVRIWNSVRRKAHGWGNRERHRRPCSVKAYVLALDHWAVPGIGEKSKATLSYLAAQEWPSEETRSIE